MKILSRGTSLALALILLFAGFAGPLLAGDKADPQSSKGAVVVPKPPAVMETAPAGAGSASLRIPAIAFRPINSSTNMEYYIFGSMFASSNGGGYWDAPVYLPQGAVVTNVRMYYYNTNATTKCNALFGYFNFASESGSYPGNWSSTGSSGLGFDDTGPLNITIDNTTYAYIVAWQPNVATNTMRLEGFQIFYTPPPGQNKVTVIPLN
jgi:hypothetical protein